MNDCPIREGKYVVEKSSGVGSLFGNNRVSLIDITNDSKDIFTQSYRLVKIIQA